MFDFRPILMKIVIVCKYVLAVLIIFISAKLSSQACCSGGTPLNAAIGMNFLAKGTVLTSLSYNYNLLNDQVKGTETIEDESRKRVSQSIMLKGIWGISDKWSIGVTLPYEFRMEEVSTGSEILPKLYSQGIGDFFIQAQYTILTSNSHNLLVATGLKIPTGSNNETNDLGIELPPDLQPGTGSWDLAIGSNYQLSNIFGGKFNYNLSGTARFNGSAKRFNNQQNYKFGNEFMIVTGLAADIIVGGGIFIPSLYLQYRRTYLDLTNDSLTPNTGGDWLNLIPGIAYNFNTKLQLMTSVSIPIYRYLEGLQLTTTYSFFVQLQYKIQKKSDELPGF